MNNNLFYYLSFKNLNDKVQNYFNNSLFLSLIKLMLGIWQKLTGFITKESITYRICELITIISIIILLFISPMVSTSINGAFIILAAICTTIKHLTKPETIPNKLDVLTLLVILYFSMGLISTGFSYYFTDSLKGLAKTFIFFLTYMVFLVNLENVKNIRFIVWTLVISAGIVSLYGVYQFYIKVPPYQGALWDDPNSTNYKVTRVYSFLKNPNLLAGYLIPTICMTASFYFLNIGWRKLLISFSLILQIACIFFTYSRGGWIAIFVSIVAFIIGMLIVFWQKIMSSKILKTILISAFLIGIVGTIIFLLKSPATLERISSIFTVREHSSNSFRMNVWISSFNMFVDNFWIGIGPGNSVFNKIYPLYMMSNFKALSAYNIFLETGLELGIFGLAIFIITLATHIFRTLWGIITSKDYFTKIILTGCFSALFGMIIHGMVDTVWYRPQVNILVWLVLAIITILTRRNANIKN